MPVHISLLRGINVSGQKMIKMEALRQMFEGMGFNNVTTYIQSGNVLFTGPEMPLHELSQQIKDQISHTFGFDVPVITAGLTELSTIWQNNPFLPEKENEKKYLHVTFLSDIPDPQLAEALLSGDYSPDVCIISGKGAYMYCPAGYHNSKLTNQFLEKKLHVQATTRNWNTVGALVGLAEKM